MRKMRSKATVALLLAVAIGMALPSTAGEPASTHPALTSLRSHQTSDEVMPRRAKKSTNAPNGPCPRDPYPCGGEWPEDVSGDRFVLDRVDEVHVTAHDGTVLAGWIAFPKPAPGVDMPQVPKFPTVLSSSPYYDSVSVSGPAVNPTHPSIDWWSDTTPMDGNLTTHSAGFPPIRLIRKGYALAYFSVRGTGDSGGCFDWGGDLDQADQRSIINWIAARSWSNKRVGTVGLSAPSQSSWKAAVAAPKALKTIVTAGDLINLYEWWHTPQGSQSVILSNYAGVFSGQLTLTGGLSQGRTGIATRAGCDPARVARNTNLSLVTGDRNADYYSERTMSTKLRRIKAAVLDTSGYLDKYGHYGQDATVWGGLDPQTPRVAIRGYWGHDHPTPWNAWRTQLPFDWEQYVTRWFDYWLKGIGDEPRTGVVHHQDQNLDWHEATSWSPAPDKKEVLYLSQDGLSTAPTLGEVAFRSAPSPLEAQWWENAFRSQFRMPELDTDSKRDNEGVNPVLCPTPLDAGLSHAYTTPVVASPVLIAGNPFADVTISSDLPGGTVTVSMYDIEPGFTCTGSLAKGARYIASGSADLNFHATPYKSSVFPLTTPTEVRIDLSDTTYKLEAGHRLALLVSNGGPFERSGSRFTPNIAIHGGEIERASHIVVPVAEGTLGGKQPTLRYPRRPFTLRGYRD